MALWLVSWWTIPTSNSSSSFPLRLPKEPRAASIQTRKHLKPMQTRKESQFKAGICWKRIIIPCAQGKNCLVFLHATYQYAFEIKENFKSTLWWSIGGEMFCSSKKKIPLGKSTPKEIMWSSSFNPGLYYEATMKALNIFLSIRSQG